MSPSVSGPPIRRIKSKNILSRPDHSDPLSLVLQPPANETPNEKQARLQQERLAKQRSDEIDRFLKQQDDSISHGLPSAISGAAEATSSKKGRVYKMVLLGQAGAGKTTVLKQMRLLYDPQAHERERKGWARIVLLNLISSVRVLLQTLSLYHDQRLERKSSEMSRLEGNAVRTGKNADEAARMELAREVGPKNELNTSSMPWTAHVSKLVQLEQALRSELGAFGEEAQLPGHSDTTDTRVAGQANGSDARYKSGDKSPLLLKPGWQARLFTYARRSLSSAQVARDGARREEDVSGDDHSDESLKLLRDVQSEVLALWTDDVSCRALRKRGLFLDGQSDAATSYFLDSYSRIIEPAYQPTDNDILHSRVRTVGVTEDVFRVDRSLIYRIYDVGGSRSQRAAWAPFLDDVESIVFLAPLSAFDQPLVEDPSTNRLADTFTLFNQIVANPLLRHASMILFLNKIDLLEKKLRQGVRLQKYWPEYVGNNDFEAVWRWFRAKFRDALRRAEDEARLDQGQRRRLYVHTTVATSTVQIRAILMSVKDSILRENLRVTGLVG
ncbi:putative Guanine nucleotide-binding protein alpha-2 subunit (putative) [Pseudozyma hubeiensis]|nr:putative Guanine nucleotide-binding protein alpha-2 subunit (putative) [Pseudozyma hubeiensis]